MRKVIILCGIFCAVVMCNQLLLAEFSAPNNKEDIFKQQIGKLRARYAMQKDYAKLQKLIAQYPGAAQKTSIIDGINKLRARYQDNRYALVEIDSEFIKALADYAADLKKTDKTDYAASYEKTQQDLEERQREDLLQRWSQATTDLAKSDIAEEIGRTVEDLKSRKRFLAALELGQGLDEKKKEHAARQFPFDPKKLYREDLLPDVMRNLDYGFYQDGKENSAQKLFWHIQQIVLAANTYLLLNIINARPMYTDLKNATADLVVALAQNTQSDIGKKLEALIQSTSEIDSAILLGVKHCTNAKEQQTLFINPQVFDDERKILEKARGISFATLAQNIHTAWLDTKKSIKFNTTTLTIDQTKKDLWIPLLSSLSANIRAAFEKHYNLDSDTEKAKAAFLLGIGLPTTFDGLVWRHVPPITDLSTNLLHFDALRCKQEKDPQRALPIHQMAREAQALVTTTRMLRERLETANVKQQDINLILYSLRKEINQKLANLQSAILELHQDLNSLTNIVADEVVVLDALADTSIFSLHADVEKALTQDALNNALHPSQQDIEKELESKNNKLVQIKEGSKTTFDTLWTIRETIYQQAGISDPKKLSVETNLKDGERSAIAQATKKFLDSDIKKMQLYTVISELQNEPTLRDKLTQHIKEMPAEIKTHITDFLKGAGGLPEKIVSLFSRTSMPSTSKIDWETVKMYIIAALVIIVVIAVVAGLIYLSCGVIAPWLGYPWYYGLFFSPSQLCWFKVLGLKKSSYPSSQAAPDFIITPKDASKALCINFIKKSPDVTIAWELSAILFDLMVTHQIMKNKPTEAPLATILDITQNSAWQHLTLARKAIENIEDKTIRENRMQQLTNIRTELKTHFETQRGVTQTA